MAVTLFLFISNSCNKIEDGVNQPGNGVYLSDALAYRAVAINISPSRPLATETITPQLVKPANRPVQVRLAVDRSLVLKYNEVNNTDFEFLPEKYYTLSDSALTIPANSVVGGSVSVNFNLTDALPRKKRYLLPVTIIDVSSGMPILNSSATAFYSLGGSTVVFGSAASLNQNYFAANLTGAVFQNMKELTYQIRLYGYEFVGPAGIMGSDHGSPPGVELRMGDFANANNAFGLAVGSATASILPTIINTLQWYNITTVCDNGNFRIYVNGALVKSGTYSGSIDLTKKRFTMGFCYDNSYNLNALINEARVWSRALTAEEIADNPCEVVPSSPGLEAYWKFNEGTGNIAYDLTGHGFDASAMRGDVVWVADQLCK
jgi:hypothetical protein